MTLTRWLSRLVGCYALTLASPLGAQGLDPPPKAAADPPPPAASAAPGPAAPSPSTPRAPAPLAEPPEWAETPASRPPEDGAEKAPPRDGSADTGTSEQRSPEQRQRSLSEGSALLGATGL